MRDDLKYQPSVAFVSGYLPDIDFISKQAKSQKLFQRFSIALDTYNPEIGEMYFDKLMAESLLLKVATFINYDEVEFGKKPFRFNSFQKAVEVTFVERPDIEAPFDNANFYRSGNIVCRIETQYYSGVGGPNPYHDTYNFAIFMKVQVPNLQQALIDCCSQNGYAIREIAQGKLIPKHSLIARLRRLF